MDKYLNSDEERLFDLLESKDADQLTTEERQFVLQQIGLDEYSLQRNTMRESAAAFGEIPEPVTFSVPTSHSGSFFGKSVPLWQALTAVAATILLFLVLWPDSIPGKSQTNSHSQQLSHTDTVILTQTRVDTVIRYIREQREAGKENTLAIEPAPIRMLEGNTAVVLPEISNEIISQRGRSLNDDTATQEILRTIYRADAR
jgi:hypothetical protein